MNKRVITTFILATLAAVATVACNVSYEVPSGSPGDEAIFRARAKDMYRWLLMPSCVAPVGFDRRMRLSEEIRAVDQLERQVRSGPASSHLQVARADASYELEREERCWEEYSSTDWAEKHVEMTKELVLTSQPKLEALAPSLSPLPTSFADQPQQAAEFRYLVRGLLVGVSPVCPLSETTPNEDLLRPASDLVAGLKRDLADTVFADQFAIAEADVAQELSETLVECATPSNASAQQLTQEMETDARKEVEAINALVHMK